MAANGTLDLAVRLLRALRPTQSQAALASQALDCAPVVEALGYYDLADHLRAVHDPEGYSRPPEPPLCTHTNGAGFYCRLPADHRVVDNKNPHEGYWMSSGSKSWTGRFLRHPELRPE